MLFFLIQLLLLASRAPLHVSSRAQLCHSDEGAALLVFKKAFTFYAFPDETSCGTPHKKTKSWKNNTNCCQWNGVTCHPSTGHVTELDLSCSLLTGIFPSNGTLFLLRHLRHLNLAFNYLSSTISPQVGLLSNLRYLNLSNSGLSGQVPPEIGHLSRLNTLDLSYLDATMPNFKTIIANLSNLRELDLSFLSINTDLPPTIANLSKLTSLTLTSCGLQGEFPVASILSMPELRILQLGANSGMSGDLSSPTLKWSSSLQVVDLSSCNFKGELPDSIGDTSNSSLGSFHMSDCGLSGDIPSWVWNVTEEIGLAFNHDLAGSLPATVNTTKLARLSSIYLHDNSITGTIPVWMFALPSLNTLNLEGNLFTGLSQSSISNGSASSSLVEIRLSSNQLQGPIPETIFELRNLQILDLQRNRLSGVVPLSKLHKLQDLDILLLSHNNLSIVDDMDADESISSMPSFSVLGLSSCNLGHFPIFLRDQENLGSLELSNNGIHGHVPHWFLDMGTTSLILDLSHNYLTGGLEHLPWQNMILIDIRSNMLEGDVPIPAANTKYFWASNNHFTGDLPSSLCDMTSLHVLDLSSNNLTGNIPECFASLVRRDLLILDLRQNQLEGIIPSIFNVCRGLFTLRLNDNQFQGSIPQSLNKCVHLQLLDLGNNKLNGTFPYWLDVASKLEVLILSSNNLHGPLMSSNMTNPFPKLRILDISNNDISGRLPGALLASFKAMTGVHHSHSRTWPYMGVAYYQDTMMAWFKGFNRQLDGILFTLVAFDESNNRLQGQIPAEIGDLAPIRWLSLAHNSFTGSIPPSLGNLTVLESLDLSYNRLDGKIPGELVNLISLEYFNVSENNLVGPVPTGKQFGTFSENSYLGNPGLCGEVLIHKCGRKTEPPAPAEGDGDESAGLNLWGIVLMGYGCGTFLGLVWGYCIFWARTPFWVVRLIVKIEVFAMLCRRRRRRNRDRRN